jgi:hypothetical protein
MNFLLTTGIAINCNLSIFKPFDGRFGTILVERERERE